MDWDCPQAQKRDRFKEIKKRLSQLSIEFQKNLNEENGGIWFSLKELDGVPEDVLSGLPKGEGENEGKVKLSFKYPDLWPTLKYAKNAETRKRVSIANENKCNQNIPLFKEAMVLRDEAARLLGYPNHAAFRIEDKMAKTTETVDSFLGDLRSRLAAGGLKEIEKLKELKKADVESRGETFDGHYFLWDHRFYDNLMLEKEYQLDHQKIAEYFPLQTTIRGMLEIFEELFGLVFVEVTGDDRAKISTTGKGEDIVWHEDVKLFSVWDDASEGEGFVGYLYLDLHPREGKYGHAANFNLQPVRFLPSYLRDKLIGIGLRRCKWKPPIPSHSAGVQLFQTHRQKTQSAETRRSRHTLPRAGPRHPRPCRQDSVLALPRHQHSPRLCRSTQPNARELVLDTLAAEIAESTLLDAVGRVSASFQGDKFGGCPRAHPRRVY